MKSPEHRAEMAARKIRREQRRQARLQEIEDERTLAQRLADLLGIGGRP